MTKSNKIIGVVLALLGLFLILSFAGINVLATTSGSITINVQYATNIQQTTEQLGTNELLAIETFSGGSTVSKTSFRYPVVRFPSILSPIIIDAETNSIIIDSPVTYVPDTCDLCENVGDTGRALGSCLECIETSEGNRWKQQTTFALCTEEGIDVEVTSKFNYIIQTWETSPTSCPSETIPSIINRLSNGETLQVPETQTWTIFYILENNYQLPTICDIIDAETQQCLHISPGVLYVCSEGQFDPSLGLCAIQPESRIICPEGGRYDVSLNVCIWNPPLQAVCPTGSVYNVNGETCQYTPQSEYVCNSGFVYNPSNGKCESYPTSMIYCPGGFAYDINSGMCIQYPDSRIVCPEGSTFNSNSGACEYYPSSNFICNIGFTYNSVNGACEYQPANEIVCPDGVYDPSLGTCVLNPPAQQVCAYGGMLTDIGN